MLIEVDQALFDDLMYWLARDGGNDNLTPGLQSAFDAFAYKPIPAQPAKSCATCKHLSGDELVCMSYSDCNNFDQWVTK